MKKRIRDVFWTFVALILIGGAAGAVGTVLGFAIKNPPTIGQLREATQVFRDLGTCE